MQGVDAIVMTGAATKGAFTAGALSVLTDPAVAARLDLDIQHVVGASSGAMNGAYLATEIRQGRFMGAGNRLARMWVDNITATRLFRPSLSGLLSRRGIFNMSGILDLSRKLMKTGPGVSHVTLKMTLTDIDGRGLIVDGQPTTTYEQVASFRDEQLDGEEALERVRLAACASGSIPPIFVPIELTVEGRRLHAVDGGTVDDTPLYHALEEDVRRVILIDPYPRMMRPPASLAGTSYLGQLVQIITQQRLVRDLHEVRRTNESLARLANIALPDHTHRAVLSAIGWLDRGPVRVLEIRPPQPLPGSDFAGAFSQWARQQYVDAGVRAAVSAINKWSWRCRWQATKKR